MVGLFRKRVDEAGLPEALLEHLLAVQPALVGVEEAAYRQEATAGLVLRLRQLLSGRLAANVEGVRVTTDKVARARLRRRGRRRGSSTATTGFPCGPPSSASWWRFP